MDGQILETMTEWETVPVADGAEGLAALEDREFTGAVTDGVAWLFFLNGRGIGLVDGAVDDFTDASLTARTAPDDALPLLYAMMSDGTETRAKYYTEETPLSAAHETLESGGFTGFVELSENVLSGDYYVVYYGGRSLPVAFVGASRKLLTGDEAFERADDEVGIYRVEEATVSVLDLPTAAADGVNDAADADDADGQAATALDVGTADGETPDDGTERTEGEKVEDAGVGFDATAALGGDADEPATGEPATDEPAADEPATDESDAAASPADAESDDGSETADGADAETDADGEPEAAAEANEPADARAESETGAESTETGTDAGRVESEPAPDAAPEAASTGESVDGSADEDDEELAEVTFGEGDGDGGDTTAATDATATETNAGVNTDTGTDPLDEEAQWRETQVIPPLSPDDEGAEEVTMADSTSERSARRRPKASNEAATGEESASLAELRERLERVEAERAAAEERAAEAEAERDEAEAERDELREEADRLRERVESLEAEVERLEGESEEATESAAMSAESALAGTSLFVRYDTKGGATLEKAHDGDADREDVNGNLRLEYHTTFDSDPVTVDGEGFETFLYDTTEYEFVRWLVEDFIYELQDTGNTGSMRELYDVLPEIDRVEFSGSVSLKYHENGEEHREQRTFDVVARDRMGNTLAVADINPSREATDEAELTSLVEGTKKLGETTDTVAAAFSVTASFFDPGALEVATEETKNGLLGRSKGKSYVKLSRKRGFHLVLVESRHGQFHVNVPEL